MGFQDFPFLTREEFSEVCHQFDRLYRQATLGPIRKRWKLRVCTALETSFATDAEYITYIQIVRPLEATLDHDDLSSHINKFSFNDTLNGDTMEEDTDTAMAENADIVGLNSSYHFSLFIQAILTKTGGSECRTCWSGYWARGVRNTPSPDISHALPLV
jgi:ubiquitin-like-conjugating enzyme ATG10